MDITNGGYHMCVYVVRMYATDFVFEIRYQN